MQADLADHQLHNASFGGELTGPDGIRYVRRTSRMKRSEVAELVRAGTPIVLCYWAGGQLTWYDGPDAEDAWQEARVHLTSSVPRPNRKHVVWTAGQWEDGDDRVVLVLTGHC